MHETNRHENEATYGVGYCHPTISRTTVRAARALRVLTDGAPATNAEQTAAIVARYGW